MSGPIIAIAPRVAETGHFRTDNTVHITMAATASTEPSIFETGGNRVQLHSCCSQCLQDHLCSVAQCGCAAVLESFPGLGGQWCETLIFWLVAVVLGH